MAYDVFKPLGPTKASKPDAGGGSIRSEPVLGVVKNNVDPTRSGRIQVYLQDIGGSDPDDSNNWVTVRYLSPFYGVTSPSAPASGNGSYVGNSVSYGMWYAAPDLGTTVLCVFANGDMNYGYYIGAVPQPEALHMVPAIGSSKNVTMNSGEAESLGGATQLPVTNLNTNNTEMATSQSFLTEAKPVHSYAAAILAQQGLARDPIRGPITSSSQRETPSRVGWGVSTPGRPIYEGGYDDSSIKDNLDSASSDSLKVVSRRAGHSFVMDDGDLSGKDQLIRIRSSLGHQILMSDDGQTLFIIHANGQSYVELGKEGTIDLYAANSVNVRTQGDLNLHADKNINLNASESLNIAAKSITLNSEKDMGFRVGGKFSNYVMGNFTVKADGGVALSAKSSASLKSSGSAYINGATVRLNSGSPSITPSDVAEIPVAAHSDTLFDSKKGWAEAPGKLKSIVSRAPAHAPWANANLGVDVKVDNNADSSLPAPASSDVAAANSNVPPTDTVPTSPALAATAPKTDAASSAMDKETTAAVVSTSAVETATGSAAAAATNGTAVVDGSLKVGALGLTPEQMESAGTLKPGSAAQVAALTASGADPSLALTDKMFTGEGGVNGLKDLISSTASQVSAKVTSLKKSAQELISNGIILDKESASQIAGLVAAAATVGTAAVAAFVKSKSTADPALTNAISSGNYAARMIDTSGSQDTVNNAQGSAAAGFADSLSQFPKAAVGTPVILPDPAPTNPGPLPGLDTVLTLINDTNNPSLALTATADERALLNRLGSESLSTIVAGTLTEKEAAIMQKTVSSWLNNGMLTAAGQASGTVNRASQTAQMSSVLGSDKVPTPGFGAEAKPKTTLPEVSVVTLKQAEADALAAYETAKQVLPQGDPQIAAALVAYNAAVAKTIAAS